MLSHQVINDEAALINTGRELDNNNAHEMVELITELQSKQYKYVFLDFTELEFLSSAGVGSILGTIEILREAGGDIVICNASEKILHILDVLDLTDYLTIKKSVEEARKTYVDAN